MATRTKQSGSGVRLPFEAFGIAGCAIIGICCLITAIGFTGYLHEGYSMLNHMISELGMASESPLAWVFNIGLMVGSPAIIIFIWGTRTVLPTRFAGLARLIGYTAGVGGFFVGVFPADGIIIAHGLAAMMFFFGGATTVAIFSVEIARQRVIHIGKWLCIGGIFVVTCFAIFLVDMFTLSAGASINDADTIQLLATYRPPVFWRMAFLEWLPLIGIIAWLLLAAVDLLKRKKKTQST